MTESSVRCDLSTARIGKNSLKKWFHSESESFEKMNKKLIRIRILFFQILRFVFFVILV